MYPRAIYPDGKFTIVRSAEEEALYAVKTPVIDLPVDDDTSSMDFGTDGQDIDEDEGSMETASKVKFTRGRPAKRRNSSKVA